MGHGHHLSCSLNIIFSTLHTYRSCCTAHRHSAASGSPHNAVSMCLVQGILYSIVHASTNALTDLLDHRLGSKPCNLSYQLNNYYVN